MLLGKITSSTIGRNVPSRKGVWLASALSTHFLLHLLAALLLISRVRKGEVSEEGEVKVREQYFLPSG